MIKSIAIAGCGVAGLTAAMLLARQGHRVSLFEQCPEVGPAGAGVLLQPSGQLVLARLGLLDRVVARAQRIDHLHALTHRGNTLVDLPYGRSRRICMRMDCIAAICLPSCIRRRLNRTCGWCSIAASRDSPSARVMSSCLTNTGNRAANSIS
ncbi:MAG TPA: NAD(P)-binding protein [Humisphaera sp.]|nr:NAD(P)-binding protein [Humisphaera sp.]